MSKVVSCYVEEVEFQVIDSSDVPVDTVASGRGRGVNNATPTVFRRAGDRHLLFVVQHCRESWCISECSLFLVFSIQDVDYRRAC